MPLIRKRKPKKILWFGVVLCVFSLLVFQGFRPNITRAISPLPPSFPPAQIHPLPPLLNQWHSENQENYFEAIKPSALGYLVWSNFPVKVYMEPVGNLNDRTAQRWLQAIEGAMEEWSAYIPLEKVSSMEKADIIWKRSRPERKIGIDRENRRLIIPEAKAGETYYQFYLRPSKPPTLAHRITILLPPTQNDFHLRGTARHELGHALGIWGHSDRETDVLYASQVRNPPPISPRDLNTLKKIYQQPTRLGWTLNRQQKSK